MKNLLPQLKVNRDTGQSGINMVDLMMWLVIAALLLAAAIQGIGYYQKNAYLYQMKSDALHAAETITAKVANTDGKFTTENVDAGVGDSKKTTDVTVEAEDGTSDAAGYVLRTTHPNVGDKDVVFLSKQRGTYAPGVHVVPKGTVIDDDGGTTVTPPGDGSGGGTDGGGTDGGATFTPIANSSSSPVDGLYLTRMNTELAAFASPEYLAYVQSWSAEVWSDESWDAYYASSAGSAYENGASFTVAQQAKFNSMNQQTAGGVSTLWAAYLAAEDAFYDDGGATAENQQAMVSALESLYEAAVATPLPSGLVLVASPNAPSSFGTITVAAGSTANVEYKYALPASVGVTWTNGTLDNYNNYSLLFGGPPAGFGGIGSDNFRAVNENGLAVWTGSVIAPNGGWQPGTYVVTPVVRDNTTMYNYFTEITIKVE